MKERGARGTVVRDVHVWLLLCAQGRNLVLIGTTEPILRMEVYNRI